MRGAGQGLGTEREPPVLHREYPAGGDTSVGI